MKFKVGDPCVAETPNGLIAGIVMAGPDDSQMATVAYPFLHEGVVSLTYQKVKPEQIHKVVELKVGEAIGLITGGDLPPREEILARARKAAAR